METNLSSFDKIIEQHILKIGLNKTTYKSEIDLNGLLKAIAKNGSYILKNSHIEYEYTFSLDKRPSSFYDNESRFIIILNEKFNNILNTVFDNFYFTVKIDNQMRTNKKMNYTIGLIYQQNNETFFNLNDNKN